MSHDPQDLQKLFLRLVKLPSIDWPAVIDQECGSDVALRQRIEGLLKAHQEPDSLLDRPSDHFEATMISDAGNAAQTNLLEDEAEDRLHQTGSTHSGSVRIGATHIDKEATTGAVISDRYTLVQQIGEGGMGEVWVAKQSSPVKRKVALKLIKTGMNTKAVLARFEQERQALALMDHPNIATVLDAGITPTGQPFFVMELVNGLPLNKFCDEAKLTPTARLELFVPICQAVQHAHQKGIVHRDLKPANILVTIIDGRPVPKVIDFGVAKATSGKLTDDSMSTQFGAVVGTLEYMSPEQAGFSGEDIDTRADIYSLGVILYEMLTGLRPIDARRLKNAAMMEMIRIVREDDPSRPSARLSTDDSLPSMAALRQTDPKKLMALLRGELDWVVMKCLEKQRDRRYETANALSRDIQRYLADEAVEARPATAGYRLQKFVTRNKTQMIAVSLVLMALTVGILGTSVGFVRARSERDAADHARIEAQDQKKIADDQRLLAVENARQAERQLAYGLISQADAFSLAQRFLEARQIYVAAYEKFVQLKEPLAAAQIGLWSSFHVHGSPLRSFSTQAQGVAISPDGRTVLSGGDSLTLWDLTTGRELRSLTGHKRGISAVAISSDGQQAVSASWDNTVKLWDLSNGKELRTFNGHTAGVSSIAISADGQTLLSGSADGTMKLWDLVSGNELHSMTGYRRHVTSVAIFPDGQSALSCGDFFLKAWDLNSGKELRTFNESIEPGVAYGALSLLSQMNEGGSVAISPDGQTAFMGGTKSLKLWDLATNEELRTFVGHTGGVTSVAVSADGKTGLSGGSDKTVQLWDLTSGKQIRAFIGHTESVSSVAISRDSRTAVSSAGDKTLKLWDLNGGVELHDFTENRNSLTGVTISPDGRTAISACRDRVLTQWDLASGKELQSLPTKTAMVNTVVISPDGQTAIFGDNDVLKLWDLVSGKELRAFTGHTSAVTSVVVSADGRTAVSGSQDKTLKVWDLTSGRHLRTLAAHTEEVCSVAISPNGSTFLSASFDGTLRHWDLASGTELRTLIRNVGAVTSIAISSDGNTAISGGSDKALRLWNLSTGKELLRFTGHTTRVTCVAIFPDGKNAISGSSDGTLKLWDMTSGKELRTFAGHAANVSGLAISADGGTVLSCGLDRSFKLWNLARHSTQLDFERRVTAAQGQLQHLPNDPDALNTLGEWYAFRGMDEWAIDFLSRAREQGKAISSLTMARSCWRLNRLTDAQQEFQLAKEQSNDVAERAYLDWCITSINTEPQRNRDSEARLLKDTARRLHLAGDVDGLVTLYRRAVASFPSEAWSHVGLGGALFSRGDFEESISSHNEAIRLDPENLAAQTGLTYPELALGRWEDAIARLKAISDLHPLMMHFSLRLATLQAWFGQDEELASTRRTTRELANGTLNKSDKLTDLMVVIMIGCLRPFTDPTQSEESLALARRAVEIMEKDGTIMRSRLRFQLELGMAEFRSGLFAEAANTLEPNYAGGGNSIIDPTAEFFRAMSLHQIGRTEEARNLAIEAASRMPPMPADEKRLTRPVDANYRNLIMWMAYKEAKSMLQFEAPVPQKMPTTEGM